MRGGGGGVQYQIPKKNRSKYFSLKQNDAKFLRIAGKGRELCVLFYDHSLARMSIDLSKSYL